MDVFSRIKSTAKGILNSRGEKEMADQRLLTMVEEAKSDGEINEDEGQLLISAIEFYDRAVYDILTPRVDVVAVDIEESRENIKTVFRASGYSRLPVYRDTIDNVVGILNEKDFHYSDDIHTIIKPAVFIFENTKISKAMAILKHKKSHLAIVTDEYGGTVGVVSLEDIIEELVGEIWDEHDLVKEDFTCISADKYRVSGKTEVDKLFEIFDIPEDVDIESTTVSGFVAEVLGDIPKVGDSFCYKNLCVTVTKAEQNRTEEVIVSRNAPTQDKDE